MAVDGFAGKQIDNLKEQFKQHPGPVLVIGGGLVVAFVMLKNRSAASGGSGVMPSQFPATSQPSAVGQGLTGSGVLQSQMYSPGQSGLFGLGANTQTPIIKSQPNPYTQQLQQGLVNAAISGVNGLIQGVVNPRPSQPSPVDSYAASNNVITPEQAAAPAAPPTFPTFGGTGSGSVNTGGGYSAPITPQYDYNLGGIPDNMLPPPIFDTSQPGDLYA